MHCYEKELSLFKFQLMTSGCRCAEKDLCQTALMRSKTVIQFRAAVSWRRRIIKLRFADANRGIMGQLCKSLPIWKWTKKRFCQSAAQNCTFPYFFASRKHSHPEKNDKKKNASASLRTEGSTFSRCRKTPHAISTNQSTGLGRRPDLCLLFEDGL